MFILFTFSKTRNCLFKWN